MDLRLFLMVGYDFRFKTSDRLVKYLKVKEWDAPYGYIVVDCLHEKLGVVEDYIDLLPVLDNLYFNAKKFFSADKKSGGALWLMFKN